MNAALKQSTMAVQLKVGTYLNPDRVLDRFSSAFSKRAHGEGITVSTHTGKPSDFTLIVGMAKGNNPEARGLDVKYAHNPKEAWAIYNNVLEVLGNKKSSAIGNRNEPVRPLYNRAGISEAIINVMYAALNPSNGANHGAPVPRLDSLSMCQVNDVNTALSGYADGSNTFEVAMNDLQGVVRKHTIWSMGTSLPYPFNEVERMMRSFEAYSDLFMPGKRGVRVRLGFSTNAADMANLKNDSYVESIAIGIVQGLKQVLQPQG